jgi:Ring finger domain
VACIYLYHGPKNLSYFIPVEFVTPCSPLTYHLQNSKQLLMYLLHHHHHHLHHHGHKYQIQRSVQEEENFSPESTFEFTFLCFAMWIFRCVVMFYANRLLSAWNNHHGNHTNPLRKTTGLNSSAIASLPVCTHAAARERELGVLIECAVCLGTVEEDELVKVLPNCRHLFHVGCIDTWLRLHSACPICRGSIEPKEEKIKI